jgi:uncharacterized protein
MDSVFLDANVLFSAAYKPGSRLLALWEREGTLLLSSAYAIEESRRNLALARPGQLAALGRLVAALRIVPESGDEGMLPDDVELADKDRPILASAIAARATHLLTGDKEHFGALYGRAVGGVLILVPAGYLDIGRR